MHIWLFQTGEPLPLQSGVRKLRTALLSDKLLERDHTLLWWGSAFEHPRKFMISKKDKTFVISNAFTIRVLHGLRYRKNVSLSRYINNMVIAKKFWLQSKSFRKPDIIIASVPCHILAYEASHYAHINHIPLLVDIRDLWPDIFLNIFKNKFFRKLGYIILAPDFARLWTVLNRADGILAVSNGYLNWAMGKIGRSPSQWDRVFFLGYKTNTKNLTQISNEKTQKPISWLEGKDSQRLIVFIGTFGISYELELLVEAAQIFQAKGKSDVCFIIAGTGEQETTIKKKAACLTNFVLTGWIGREEIELLLTRAYIGLVPCQSTLNTLPNKPFEYIAYALPLISSLEGEMAELIEKHKLGLNYRPGDLKELCCCIEMLVDNPALHKEMSINAYKFFTEKGDATKIYDEYATLIEGLAEHKKSKI